MTFYINGLLRLIALLFVVFLVFALHGGNLGIFWQPTGMIYAVAVNLFCVHWFVGFREISSIKDGERVIAVGRAALAMGSLIMIVDSILTAGILDQGLPKIGLAIGSSLVGWFYVFLVYLCFFVPHYFDIKAGKNTDTTPIPALLKAHGFGFFAVLGVLTIGMLFVLAGHTTYVSYRNQSNPQRASAGEEVQRRMSAELDLYASTNCKYMPDDQHEKRYKEIESEVFVKRGISSE